MPLKTFSRLLFLCVRSHLNHLIVGSLWVLVPFLHTAESLLVLRLPFPLHIGNAKVVVVLEAVTSSIIFPHFC